MACTYARMFSLLRATFLYKTSQSAASQVRFKAESFLGYEINPTLSLPLFTVCMYLNDDSCSLSCSYHTGPYPRAPTPPTPTGTTTLPSTPPSPSPPTLPTRPSPTTVAPATSPSTPSLRWRVRLSVTARWPVRTPTACITRTWRRDWPGRSLDRPAWSTWVRPESGRGGTAPRDRAAVWWSVRGVRGVLWRFIGDLLMPSVH